MKLISSLLLISLPVILTAPAFVKDGWGIQALHAGRADSTHNLFDTLQKPRLISSQFSFTEGPVADKHGNVYFTDQPNNKIWKYGINGKLSVFMENSGRANGLYFDKKGNLIACADEHNQLWSISPRGKVTVLLKDLEGKRLNGPNDVWVAPNGGLYFTDPYYQRDYWTHKQPELDGQKVYYLANGSKKPVIADSDLKQPNGIIGSADGKYLYVADIGDGKIYKYTINNDGSLTNRTLHVKEGSDGMTLDERGNIYITFGSHVSIFNKTGNLITRIKLPEQWTANVCFGGRMHDILFITASKSLYMLKMNVKGD
ncbi:SMP-30/gluconolactonase/LRE family protein [Mucilaginibacter hurinus]|uniref:SMP-30/gluconolactonase/LRE family protein n=1 Tax=Mucilaginibacter hurinus TaxID=2201324 RepID=A0A367GRH7_9SPHI|nr:SMP-30/gluconolactonase/LRE family protein [Mucilaginibacter hurinus]RCH56064.1 SMP-30/gluconolactonase/LRE family protein [Mucilaginibacter hurinus]